ncbi:hypothetical protein ABPG77_003425 [Micractinium sp. CCAP 211/92]
MHSEQAPSCLLSSVSCGLCPLSAGAEARALHIGPVNQSLPAHTRAQMMPSTLPTLPVVSADQAGKPGADMSASPASGGLPSMPMLPSLDMAAWTASGPLQMDGAVLPQIPQLFVANQDGATTGAAGAATSADGAMQMPMLQMPALPLTGQLPLFMPFPLVPIASGTATTTAAAGAGALDGQPWAVPDLSAAGSIPNAMQMPAVTLPAGMAATAARAQAEATVAAARAAKAAAPPSGAGSRRRPVRRAASLAAAAWASSDEDEQQEEGGWARPKRARRGFAEATPTPPAAPPAGPSQYQQRRAAQQQLQMEVVEVAGVAARMVACVAAACGEPVLPDTLGVLPGTAGAQRAAAAQQPMSYAQLLMQELPDEESSPTGAAAAEPPRVSRFGRTVRPSVHRTGALAAAALVLEAPPPRPSTGRPGRPPRNSHANGGLAPFLDDAEPQEEKVCAECGTRTTPLWRTINGLTYCNADGLRMKRKLGML